MSSAVPERGFRDSINYSAMVRPAPPFFGPWSHGYAGGLPCGGDDSGFEYDTNLHS
jgi:hypothetical protein